MVSSLSYIPARAGSRCAVEPRRILLGMAVVTGRCYGQGMNVSLGILRSGLGCPSCVVFLLLNSDSPLAFCPRANCPIGIHHLSAYLPPVPLHFWVCIRSFTLLPPLPHGLLPHTLYYAEILMLSVCEMHWLQSQMIWTEYLCDPGDTLASLCPSTHDSYGICLTLVKD